VASCTEHPSWRSARIWCFAAQRWAGVVTVVGIIRVPLKDEADDDLSRIYQSSLLLSTCAQEKWRETLVECRDLVTWRITST
jgi:hypothetical protein